MPKEPLNDGVVLMGELATLILDREDIEAINYVHGGAVNDTSWFRSCQGDAQFDVAGDNYVGGVSHYTHKGVAVFFKWASPTLSVYAVGRHGKTNKTYSLYTYLNAKPKGYTF